LAIRHVRRRRKGTITAGRSTSSLQTTTTAAPGNKKKDKQGLPDRGEEIKRTRLFASRSSPAVSRRRTPRSEGEQKGQWFRYKPGPRITYRGGGSSTSYTKGCEYQRKQGKRLQRRICAAGGTLMKGREEGRLAEDADKHRRRGHDWLDQIKSAKKKVAGGKKTPSGGTWRLLVRMASCHREGESF